MSNQVQVRVQVAPRWQVLAGHACGIGQRAMLGELAIDLPGRFDFTALDAAMAAYVDDPLPRQPPADAAVAFARRLLHWSTAVQRRHRVPVFGSGLAWRGGARAQRGGGQVVQVAVPIVARGAGSAALGWALRTALGHLRGDAMTEAVQQERRALSEKLQAELAAHRERGTNMYRFIAAAHESSIPWRPVVPGVYAFGSGRGSRWLGSSFTDRTPAIGANLARDKVATASVLRQWGLPGARHRLARSAEQAVEAAGELGYPVVVKPADRDQGTGVAANLRTPQAVAAAYGEAIRHSQRVLVEKHFHGKDYRLTVFNGRVIKVSGRVAGGVTGDGVQTVAQLVAEIQRSEVMRRRARERGHDLLTLDAEALDLLAEEGLSPDSVPAAGRYLCLRRRSNISAGGRNVPVALDAVHPDNLQLAVRAAAALRLDLAGIDLIIEDVSRSWLQTGALICEVNAQPQIGLGATPTVYADILRELVPGDGRMPALLVVGDAQACARVLQALQARLAGQAPGLRVGCGSAEGLWVGATRLSGPLDSGFAAGRALLADQDLDAVAVAMTPQEIVRLGLPMDRFELLLAGAAQAGSDQERAALSAAWPMLLPHVAGTVIVEAGESFRVPQPAGGAPHRGPPLRWLRSADAAYCLEQACLCLLEGAAGR